jgi:sugar phosphate isomerase/epimerase
MLAEIAALGFQHAELSHGIKITLVPGILRAVQEGVVTITSTHNFCPLPTGVIHAAPNLYEPSALRAQEHEQWVRHTKRSIDFAAQVKAEALVCHLGSVRYRWFNPGRHLARYLREHPEPLTDNGAAKYRALREKCLLKLRQRMQPYWSQVRSAIEAVVEHARAKGVRLGFENRERFEELPLDGDHVAFLESLGPGAPVGYWHDTGHARIKEQMGLLEHRMHLETLAPRTIGFHLHDVDEQGRDHRPIGHGQIDFEMVRAYWRPEHLLTLELSPRVPVEEVLDSKRRLEALME